MGKKNPYITTIGFDKTDPRHVQVAELLNGMSRKKAQYIVDAVLAYESMRDQGAEVARLPGIGYEQIKPMVLRVLAEQGVNVAGNPTGVSSAGRDTEAVLADTENQMEIDADALDGIMESLAAFRE